MQDELELMVLPPVVKDDTKDFFSELRDKTEALVQNSLFLYTAYDIKAEEAASYKEDPKSKVPHLRREAELRGVTVDEIASMVLSKKMEFREVVGEVELIRIEFNLKYPTLTSYESQLRLRDELIGKLKVIMSKLE